MAISQAFLFVLCSIGKQIFLAQMVLLTAVPKVATGKKMAVPTYEPAQYPALAIHAWFERKDKRVASLSARRKH